MRLWSRLCNLVPAIIVENILWSTLFTVLIVLTWIVFSSYLVSDILLFPVFVWKVVEGVFCLELLLFYTADIILVGKLFWYFSSLQGENIFFKDIYINNYNNYNCNKQKPSMLVFSVLSVRYEQTCLWQENLIQNTILATYTWLWSRDCALFNFKQYESAGIWRHPFKVHKKTVLTNHYALVCFFVFVF